MKKGVVKLSNVMHGMIQTEAGLHGENGKPRPCSVWPPSDCETDALSSELLILEGRYV